MASEPQAEFEGRLSRASFSCTDLRKLLHVTALAEAAQALDAVEELILDETASDDVSALQPRYYSVLIADLRSVEIELGPRTAPGVRLFASSEHDKPTADRAAWRHTHPPNARGASSLVVHASDPALRLGELHVGVYAPAPRPRRRHPARPSASFHAAPRPNSPGSPHGSVSPPRAPHRRRAASSPQEPTLPPLPPIALGEWEPPEAQAEAPPPPAHPFALCARLLPHAALAPGGPPAPFELRPDEPLYFELPLPPSGARLTVSGPRGDVRLFASRTCTRPSPVAHEFRVSTLASVAPLGGEDESSGEEEEEGRGEAAAEADLTVELPAGKGDGYAYVALCSSAAGSGSLAAGALPEGAPAPSRAAFSHVVARLARSLALDHAHASAPASPRPALSPRPAGSPRGLTPPASFPPASPPKNPMRPAHPLLSPSLPTSWAPLEGGERRSPSPLPPAGDGRGAFERVAMLLSARQPPGRRASPSVSAASGASSSPRGEEALGAPRRGSGVASLLDPAAVQRAADAAKAIPPAALMRRSSLSNAMSAL